MKFFLPLFFCLIGVSLARTTEEEVPSSLRRRLQQNSNQGSRTIEELVVDRWGLQRLEDLLIAANLAPSGPFSGEGPFTVFAPTTLAFRRTFERYPGLDTILLNDPDGALTTVLTYHALASKVLYSDVTEAGVTVKTLSDEELTATKVCRWWGWWCYIRLTDGSPDEKYVTWADIQATNGVVHLIDDVLIPPSLADIVAGLEVESSDDSSD